MLSRLFPKTIDTGWRGPRAAAWLLGLVLAFKFAMCFGTIFQTRRVALGPDGLPVDKASPEVADAMLQLLALVGFDQLVLSLVGVLALVRYRAMIPQAFLLLLIEQAGRRLLNLLHPTAHGDGLTVGVSINLALLALMVVGFGLSLTERRGTVRARRAF